MHTTTNIYVYYQATNFTFLLHFYLLFKRFSLDTLYIDTQTLFYFQSATPLPHADAGACYKRATVTRQKHLNEKHYHT